MTKRTASNNIRNDFIISNSGENRVTTALWSGHQIIYTNEDETTSPNRSFSSENSVFILNLFNAQNRELGTTGVLMHELCHQYGGKDHYHEEDKEGNCLHADICYTCNKKSGGTNGRPESCLMNDDYQDIMLSTIMCQACKNEILAHLETHH